MKNIQISQLLDFKGLLLVCKNTNILSILEVDF